MTPPYDNSSTSPQAYARACGAFYLITIVLGAMGEAVIRGRIIVPGDGVRPSPARGAVSAGERVVIIGFYA